MATGASKSDLAIILIDARKGVLMQTRRHSMICSLLGLRDVVVAVNKIDLVDDKEATFNHIVAEYRAFASTLGFTSVVAIPISARYGDNITALSDATPWYRGPSLLDYLETVDVDSEGSDKPFRFPVQWVNRPNLDFRGYAGTVMSGAIRVGDPIIDAESGQKTLVQDILTYGGSQPFA